MRMGDNRNPAAIPSTRALRAAWTEAFSRDDECYDIRRIIGNHLVAISKDGYPALIFLVDRFRPQPGRVVGKVRLRFLDDVRLELDGVTSHADVAVFECLEPSMADTFAVLVSDLLEDVGTAAPDSARIFEAFARWHDLLASRENLSAAVEQGLWGELKVLQNALDVGGAEAAWNGPTKGVIDFLRGNVGLEVKTGRHRRRHTISFDQALFGEQGYEAYLLSLYVQPNEEGETISELIEDIDNHLVDDVRFRKKLRGLGYREENSDQYQVRLKLVEAPTAFPMRVVPRIDYVPDGASNVRWDIDLSSKTESDEAELAPLMARISGEVK